MDELCSECLRFACHHWPPFYSIDLTVCRKQCTLSSSASSTSSSHHQHHQLHHQHHQIHQIIMMILVNVYHRYKNCRSKVNNKAAVSLKRVRKHKISKYVCQRNKQTKKCRQAWSKSAKVRWNREQTATTATTRTISRQIFTKHA